MDQKLFTPASSNSFLFSDALCLIKTRWSNGFGKRRRRLHSYQCDVVFSAIPVVSFMADKLVDVYVNFWEVFFHFRQVQVAQSDDGR